MQTLHSFFAGTIVGSGLYLTFQSIAVALAAIRQRIGKAIVMDVPDDWEI